jgi:hypothetical protein
MRIRLKQITPDDERTTAQLEPGEIVEHAVELDIDGRLCTFTVFLRANVLADLDASVVYGDELLEELLRFEPAGLGRLYRVVAKRRRGDLLDLPLVLVEAEPEGEERIRPRLEQLVIGPQAL